jgi:DNA-binding response OmpR family regulator
MKVLLLGFGVWDAGRLCRALGALGHEAILASNTEEAIAHLDEDGDIRFAIGDGCVPNFEWREFCDRVRSDPIRPYIYFLLRVDRREDVSHEDWAADCGVDDFLDDVDDLRDLKRRLRVAYRNVPGLVYADLSPEDFNRSSRFTA